MNRVLPLWKELLLQSEPILIWLTLNHSDLGRKEADKAKTLVLSAPLGRFFYGYTSRIRQVLLRERAMIKSIHPAEVLSANQVGGPKVCNSGSFAQRKVSNVSAASSGYFSDDNSDSRPSSPLSKSSVTISVTPPGSTTSQVRQRRMGVAALPEGCSKTPREQMLDSMTWGIDAVASDSRQGLPRELIKDILEATEERGNVFAHRPVEVMCRRPLAEGNPTKPFPIKGKSANWGLQQSFICTDQDYSKLNGSDKETIQKYNRDVAGVEKKHAIPAQLKISFERIQELESVLPDKYQRVGEEYDQKGNLCRMVFQIQSKFWETYTQQAEYCPEDGYWYVSNIVDDKEPEPLMVLCHPDSQLPITADVDPLFEAFSWEQVDLGSKDRLPVPLIAPKVVKDRLSVYEQRARHRKSSVKKPVTFKDSRDERKRHRTLTSLQHNSEVGKFLEPEIDGIGNVSPRTQEMIEHYGSSRKSAISREYPVVHHNTDATSPFSKEEDNYPATLYFPKWVVEKIPELGRGAEPVVTVHSSAQLETIIQLLVDNGLFMFINPLWKNLSKIRPKWFTETAEYLEAELPKAQLKKQQYLSDQASVRKKALINRYTQCLEVVEPQVVVPQSGTAGKKENDTGVSSLIWQFNHTIIG